MHGSTLRRSQLDRLLRIIHVLQSGRRSNVQQLAEECEVSRRTIFRDLSTIEDSGIRVEYDPARRGYRIPGDSAAGPQRLEEREVVALAILTAQNCPADPFGLTRPAREAIGKLLESLGAEPRARVEALLEALSEQMRPDAAPPTGQAVTNLLDAIARRVQVLISVRGSSHRAMQVTPYRIFADRHGWCLVGSSSSDRGVRLVELADIEELILTESPAQIPPRFRLAPWLQLWKQSRAGVPTAADTIDLPPQPVDFDGLGG